MTRSHRIRSIPRGLEARPKEVCMLRILSVAVASTLLVSAARGDDSAKADQDKLKGTWTLTSLEQGGRKDTNAALQGDKLTFEGNAYTLKRGAEVTEKGTFTVDPWKKPKAME